MTLKSKQFHPVIFRQGDVLLQKVNAIPEAAKDVTPPDRIVLAFGEVTGHAHAVYEPLTKDTPKGKARLWDAGAERFLQVLAKTSLKHEEHTAITLEPGIYRVRQQREYSPEEIRNVAD